jgi:hypothetical protein
MYVHKAYKFIHKCSVCNLQKGMPLHINCNPQKSYLARLKALKQYGNA